MHRRHGKERPRRTPTRARIFVSYTVVPTSSCGDHRSPHLDVPCLGLAFPLLEFSFPTPSYSPGPCFHLSTASPCMRVGTNSGDLVSLSPTIPPFRGQPPKKHAEPPFVGSRCSFLSIDNFSIWLFQQALCPFFPMSEHLCLSAIPIRSSIFSVSPSVLLQSLPPTPHCVYPPPPPCRPVRLPFFDVSVRKAYLPVVD